jgi:hypothetical protein
MGTLKNSGLWAGILAMGLAAGCDGGPAGAAPTADQKTQAQVGNGGSSTIEQTADIATTAIVDSGASGSTSAKSVSAKALTTINYQASVNVTVDLDALNSSGQDAYPNASGRFSVAATGSIVGTANAGQATYSVHVVWITDGVFVDPVCGAGATVTAGSGWNYSLVIQWSKADDLNWSIEATADVSGALNASVTNGTKTWTVSGTVLVHASMVFSETAGNYSLTFGISGQRTLVISDGVETHTVIFTMTDLDHIVIDLDGVSFGPYTLAQIRWWFGFDCNG